MNAFLSHAERHQPRHRPAAPPALQAHRQEQTALSKAYRAATECWFERVLDCSEGPRVRALVAWVNSLRERIADNRLRRIASTRLVEQSVKALRSGRTLDDVKARFFQDWSRDEIAKVGGAA